MSKTADLDHVEGVALLNKAYTDAACAAVAKAAAEELDKRPTKEEMEEAAAAGGAGEVYSTEETRIGTWIDGRPLYRRVVEETIPSTGAVAKIFDTSSWNIDKLTKLLGVSQAATDGSKQKIPFSHFGQFYGWIDGSGYFTMAAISAGAKLYGCPMTILFEYTKTTDTASEVISADQPIANTVSAEQDQAGQG